MRHTFQLPNVPPTSSAPQGRAVDPFIRKPSQTHKEPAAPISADTFCFKNPTDFYLYLNQRHPGLVCVQQYVYDFGIAFGVSSAISLNCCLIICSRKEHISLTTLRTIMHL